MSKSAWTIFWKTLGIVTVKRYTTVKNYNPQKDISALKRKGVNPLEINRIQNLILRKFDDELFFNKFSRFFRKDTETIKLWLNATSETDAFTKLYNIISRIQITKAKARLGELILIYKMYRKPEGRIYAVTIPKRRKLDFNPKSLIIILNRSDKNSGYQSKGTIFFGSERILCIEKKSETSVPVSKFIRLSKIGNELRIVVSMDSKKEHRITKIQLERWLNQVIDTPQIKKSLTRWENFLVSGDSKHFTLTGVTYFVNQFKLSVFPAYNRIENVALSQSYRSRIQAATKKSELIVSAKLFYKIKNNSIPIFISVFSYKNGGIIGAIKLVPDAKKMNVSERSKLYADFTADFQIPLNDFLVYDDLEEVNIYKILLEGIPQTTQIEMRSPVALAIYQSLLNDGLLSNTSTTEEQTKFCSNRDCANQYRPIWNKVYCERCGDVLLNGKTFITQRLDEQSIGKYIKAKFTSGSISLLSNTLLKRNLTVVKAEYDNDVAELLPIDSNLSEQQLEILKFRYPNIIIITTKDNIDDYEKVGIKAEKLHELVYSIKTDNAQRLKDAIEDVNITHLDHTRSLCRAALKRMGSNAEYKKANKLSKYLGAELFEADCSAIFNYVFGNSLWLGARHRGQSLPDGFTAFPLLQSQEGCFIWDGKFGEGNKIHMGKFSKNQTYIDAAKKTQSIRDNGGLKAFVFISNVRFPKYFIKKYQPLTKGSNIKIVFLSAKQLHKIASHFKRNERLILNNQNAKQQFISSMAQIFFSVRNRQKCEILDDAFMDGLLKSNKTTFDGLKQGRQLTI